jgi:pyruvate kinase
MQIYRGVHPIKTQEVNSTDHLLEEAVKTVTESGLVDKGDVVILTAGVPAGKSSVTNMIKAVVID